MFDYDQDAHQHTRSLPRPQRHNHEIDTADAEAILDADEWVGIGRFLDALSSDLIVSHTASLYEAYKLQRSIRSFVDTLISSGFYSRT